MRVVLDSNILCRDFRLAGTIFRTFLSNLGNAGHSLHIPKVVIEEVVNKYGEEFQKLHILITKMGYTVPVTLDSNRPITDLHIAKEEFRDYLRNKLSRVNCTFLDYPNVSHEVLSERAIQRRRPFRANDRGYRDALIWESILQLAAESSDTRIAFITSNYRDFANENIPEQLHPDLIADIESRRGNSETFSEIQLWQDLNSFVERNIYPILELINDIRDQLEANRYQGLNLMTFLEEEHQWLMSGKEFESEDVGLSWEINGLTFSNVQEVYSIDDIEARRLSGNELLINFTANALCEFDFLMGKAEFYSLPDDVRASLWFENRDDYYVSSSITKEVNLNLSLSFDIESQRITSAQIIAISPTEENSY